MVRVFEAAFLPRPSRQEFSVAVEHHDRRAAALKHVDPVIGVDGHRAGALERCTRRQLGPIGLILVDEVSHPDGDSHR